MKPLLPVGEDKKNDILSHALGRDLFCVVTNRSGGAWNSRKTKFIGARDTTDRLFIEAIDAATQDSIEYLSGELVGVTFRRGHRKCLFSTTVLGATSVVQPDGEIVNVIELQWPTELQELQRRAYQRAVPIDRHVTVRFWRGGVAGRQQAESADGTLLTGTLVDLSAGGMRILTSGVAPDALEEGDAVGCSFRPKSRGETLVVDGVFRHFQLTADGLGSIGVQFVGLECSEGGRQSLATLAGVVADYQRALRSRKKKRFAPRLVRQ